MTPSDDDEHDNPFSGVPFLGDIASMLGSGNETRWESARQTAVHLATGGKTEPNVDPLARHRLSELARVAELHVANVTGLDPNSGGQPSRIEPVTRSAWAADATEAIRPLMDLLADRLAVDAFEDDSGGSGPAGFGSAGMGLDPIEGLLRMISPMMVAMSTGMMAGHLAAGAFGDSDLPVPRGHDRRGDSHRDATVMIIPANIAEFASEWGLDIDDVTLWVAIRELTMRAVLSAPEVDAELDELLSGYVDGFRRASRDLDELASMAEFDMTSIDMSSPDAAQQMNQQMQSIFGNPEFLLGLTRHGDQADIVVRLESLLCVITAYVDDVAAQAGARLIGGYPAMIEAQRRRHVGTKGADFADRLLGVRLSPEALERGRAFIAGVIERSGRDVLARLWLEPDSLPTPAEVAAPGLWLARIDLPLD